jgi:Coenzyme PQQ synthesis protein D (PqqD)
MTPQPGSELPQTVSIPPDVLWQQVDGEVVVLDAAAGEYRGLNDVGSQMWLVLEAAPDVATACTRLCELYEVDEETLRRDLAAFIEQLVTSGMLVAA